MNLEITLMLRLISCSSWSQGVFSSSLSALAHSFGTNMNWNFKLLHFYITVKLHSDQKSAIVKQSVGPQVVIPV